MLYKYLRYIQIYILCKSEVLMNTNNKIKRKSSQRTVSKIKVKMCKMYVCTLGFPYLEFYLTRECTKPVLEVVVSKIFQPKCDSKISVQDELY